MIVNAIFKKMMLICTWEIKINWLLGCDFMIWQPMFTTDLRLIFTFVPLISYWFLLVLLFLFLVMLVLWFYCLIICIWSHISKILQFFHELFIIFEGWCNISCKLLMKGFYSYLMNIMVSRNDFVIYESFRYVI